MLIVSNILIWSFVICVVIGVCVYDYIKSKKEAQEKRDNKEMQRALRFKNIRDSQK